MAHGGSTVSALDGLLPLELGIAAATRPGESVSGDLHVVQPFDGGVLVAVVDALGHGVEAAAAARTVAVCLARYAHEPVGSVLRRCHETLVRSRGVVLSLASLDVAAETLTWLGVGNVAGLVLAPGGRARPPVVLVTVGGIVGSDPPPARPALVPFAPGDTLVLATDGIATGFSDALRPVGTAQQVADSILARFGKGTDDALVLVARSTGAGPRA